jgi:hypothetical protein
MNSDVNAGFVSILISRMLSIFLMAAIALMAAIFLSAIFPAASMTRENAANSREQGEEAD